MCGCCSQGRGADLAQKSFGTESGAEIRMQDLDRDIPIIGDVMRAIDGSHAAGAKDSRSMR